MKKIWLYCPVVVMVVIGGVGWNKVRVEHNRYIQYYEYYDDLLCTRGKQCDDLVFEVESIVLVVRQVYLGNTPHFVVWSDSGATDGFEARCKTRAESIQFVKKYFYRHIITSSQREIIGMIGEAVDHDLVIDYHGPRRQWQKDFVVQKYNPYVDDDIIKISGQYYRMMSVCSVERIAGQDYLAPPIVTRVKGPMPTPEKAAAQSYFRGLSQDEDWYGRHRLGDQ